MYCVWSVFSLVAFAVSVTAGLRVYPGPLPSTPISPDNVTSCAATSCIKGQICRIVVKSDGSIGSLCLDPDDVPRRGRSRVCGTSGHPVLAERRTSRRGRVRYAVFRTQRGKSCPSQDLVRRYSICCAETEKEGACPSAGSLKCRRSSCRGDNQCPENKKCCQASCGRNTCAAPVLNKFVCSTANCIPGVPCAIVDCAPGFNCVETPKGPKCEPGTPVTCALIDCLPDFTCIDFPDGSKCVPLIATCAVVKCQAGSECVETSNGAVCRPLSDKPGFCPFRPVFGFCDPTTPTCESDADCEGEKICCQLNCNRGTCESPVSESACPNVSCDEGEACLDTRMGPQCLPVNKPGQCPPPLVTKEEVGVCAVTCQNDSSCEGTEKCCPTACGGRTCTDPVPVATCASTLCLKGTICVETPTGAECRPVEKPGSCPPPLGTGEVGVCAVTCQNDSSCQGTQKCCPTACGGRTCTVSVPVATCASTSCLGGTICVDTPTGAECRPRPVEKPGSCPPPLGTGEVGVCAVTCQNDSSCEGTQKCCPTACGGRTCTDPVPVATCASVLCIVGTICVETPTGPECRPRNKPGTCPVPGPFEVGICGFTCKDDASCPSTDKCCTTACGGTACTKVITCANVLCAPGTTRCIETDEGPRCIVEKPGFCPEFQCPRPPVEFPPQVCSNECDEDNDCEGQGKCCTGCSNCRSCFDSVGLPALCDSVVCGLGEVCRLQQVICVTAPCPPIPTCVPIGSNIGQCPAVKHDTRGTCSFECETDNDCGAGEKCCLTACNGTACTTAVPISSCEIVKCGKGKLCSEVYDPDSGQVYPQCLDKPRDPPQSVCTSGLPLLLAPGEKREGVFCGRGFNRRDCPPGYDCIISPTDRFAVCCRTTSIVPKPGQCPPPVGFGICAFTCEDDASCQGAQKCCRTACGGSQCQNPITSVTKPGICPPVLCSPNPPVCLVNQCDTDGDCKGDQKCCDGCGCRTCSPPLSISTGCDAVSCPPGQKCVETNGRTECVPVEKPGTCPQIRCPYRRRCAGREECQDDGDCKGELKCCQTCTGCRQCLAPSLPPSPSCVTTKCKPGEECREQTIFCIRQPCPPPFFTCVPTAITDRQCPTARPPSNSTCPNLCSFDSECARGEKCCSTLCGGTACTPTVLPSTCDTARCPSSRETCREVYDLDTVTANCFENPLETLQDDECRVGLPLLILNLPGGDITQANCGGERDAITCPAGYSCKVGRGGAFSVCCRDEEKPCDPPCGAGKTCVTTPINCLLPPCPPTPRCEPDGSKPPLTDRCLQPKDVGPCEALIPRYFYNSETKKCEFFNYGGCQGNSNRFPSRKDCLDACSDIPDKCLLPPEQGPCRASFPRFFYNPETDDCEQFIYGGCRGNENNFESRDACLRKCAPHV